MPFDAEIDVIAFVAEISAKPSSSSSCSLRRRYRSGSERTRPRSQSLRTSCSPTPSMSAAACTQLISDSRPRDGHARFGQRCIASPSGFTISVAHSGQCVGILNGFVPRRCAPAGPTIWGITSPARCTITSSPARMSLRLMSSSLCSVAREIVTPPTSTGCQHAHGLSAPVRPTRIRICSRRVVAVRGAHLNARAQRGRWWRAPSRCCCA